MEKQINAMFVELTEIKRSNRAVLEHLNKFIQQQTTEENLGRKCSYDCVQKIKEVYQKYDLLVEESKQKDRVIKDMSIKIEALNQRLNNFGETFSGFRQPPFPLEPTFSQRPVDVVTSAANERRDMAVLREVVTEPKNETVIGAVGFSKMETEREVDQTKRTEISKEKSVVKFAQAEADEEKSKSEIALLKVPDKHRKGILKPNLVRKQRYVRADPRNVSVHHQKEKVYVPSEDYFFLMGKIELRNAAGDDSIMTKGVHTVFVIDTSASMAEGDKWVQAATFFHDFIDGLEYNAVEHDITQEHVALVVFGHELVVKQKYTNDFDLLRKSFDSIALGGPSPMYGGVVLGLHTVETVRPIATVGDFEVRTKFVLITDGKPTETCLSHGPDVVDPDKDGKTKAELFQMVLKVADISKIDIFYVSVGEGNTNFTDTFTEIAEAKHLLHEDGRKLSRRTLLAVTRDPLDHMFPFFRPKRNLSKTDREQLDEMTDKNIKMAKEMRFKRIYDERENSDLPVVGTRVRRGPDWVQGEDDKNGPGTIIGHYEEEVSVHWDLSDKIGIYRYGLTNAYDVLIVDEIRSLEPGEKVAVGCRVRPGKNLKVSSNIKSTDRGVIVRCMTDTKMVWVRWDDGRRGEYSYGENGPEEVVVSDKNGQQGGRLMIEYPGPKSADTDEVVHVKNVKKRIKNKNA